MPPEVVASRLPEIPRPHLDSRPGPAIGNTCDPGSLGVWLHAAGQTNFGATYRFMVLFRPMRGNTLSPLNIAQRACEVLHLTHDDMDHLTLALHPAAAAKSRPHLPPSSQTVLLGVLNRVHFETVGFPLAGDFAVPI
jgi:hypothetical protein